MAGVGDQTIRLDKFLFQARFFKTRPLAQQLVQKGRVRVNGDRVSKPGRLVRPGDVLTFPAGSAVRVITILALPERRGPASEARLLYHDRDSAPDDARTDESS